MKLDALIQPIRGWWFDGVLPRYYELQPREQHLVAIAAVVLPLIILLFGWILPANDARHAAEQRLATLQTQLMQANRLADQLQRADKTPPPSNVLAAVEKLARDRGVRSYMTRIKPQRDLSGKETLLLQMREVPLDLVLHFVAGVEQLHLVVDQVKLHAGKAPAKVDMRMVIVQ